jgi:hypothetical protein
MNVRAQTPEPGDDDPLDDDVEEVFAPLARGMFTEEQLRTIQFHYQRSDLSDPVYVLLGEGHGLQGTTTSKQEAEIHMKRNPVVRSYISSEALLDE